MLKNLFRRRYLISLTYLLVVIIGIAAWRTIPLEQAPNLNLPSITVTYGWGSTSPEVIEKEVTRKVEQAANRLRDVESIQSISDEGRSRVTVTFQKHTPVDYRIIELQEYLFALEETLPPNVQQGNISRQVPQELQDVQDFVNYSLSGDRDVHDLLSYAEQNIRLALLGLEGLSNIEITGARDPALMIEFDTDMLEQYDINQQQILSDIRNNMEWRSSGFIESSGMQTSMLVAPQYEDLEDIRQMEIELPGSSRIIRLTDIARVEIQDYPARSLKRINASPALGIQFVKESGADAIALAEEIRSRMDEIRQRLPEDMFIQLERDATEDLREQFGDLQYQAMISLLVVFLILLLFIRRFRAPFVILGSIVFSLLLSVSLLFFVGYTLNVITLAGLTVALGMIIDNAVVVFEQLNPRLPDEREARLEHIKKELPRTLVPVLGSTFTTVGIFIPLFFALEELQLFLVPLAVALSTTLISSVFIALSWIPYSLVWLVPYSSTEVKKKKGSAAGRKKDGLFQKRLKKPLLWLFAWRRKLRWVIYLGFVAVIGIPLFAIDEPDWEEGDAHWPEFTQVYFEARNDIDPIIGGLTYRFFNDTHFGSPWGGQQQQRINISITPPQGTPLSEIDKMISNFEDIAQPYTEAFSYFVANLSEIGSNTLTFYIKDEYLSRPEPYIYYYEAQYLAARTGNSRISVSGLGDGMSTGFGSSSSSHRISLRGFAYDQLLTLAEDLRRRLMTNRRVQEVDIHGTGYFSRDDLHQYYLELEEQELALRDINRGELFNAIGMDVNPENARGRIELNGEQMYLMSRNLNVSQLPEVLMEEKRKSGDITFALEEVASLGREKSQSQIRREDQSYFRQVSVDFLGPYRLGNNYIEEVIEETPVPVGASIEYGSGFSFSSSESTRNLLFLLGLTILSVWMIVSALLESWRDPLVVILAVPLSLIGIMAGALYHDLAFDRGAIAGTLLCVGVVVNNSILLMHEKQLFRGLNIHGLRSWLYVYRNKMRAVLITTLTTIGGLIPMIVFGESEFWERLAIVVVWGLSSSTLLLLLLMGIWEKTTTLVPSLQTGKEK